MSTSLALSNIMTALPTAVSLSFCHRYNYKVRPQVVGAAQYSMGREMARQLTHGNEST